MKQDIDEYKNISKSPLSRSLFINEEDKLQNISDNRGKKIGILIVAYNAVSTLGSVFKRIPEDVWSNVEEIAVFDDYSLDETHVIGVGYKSLLNTQKLTVLKNNKNLGYGGNQKAGYNYFMSKGFDIVVLLHGDGQYAPEMIANMYAPIVNGEADAVFGSRMMKDHGGARKGGMPFYKFLGNKILTIVENYILNMSLTEFHSGYRAYDLNTLRKIKMDDMTSDFHFDTEIIIKLNHQGFKIREIAIPTYYGDEICYVNGVKYAVNIFKSLIRYKKTVKGIKTYAEFSEYVIHYPLKVSKNSSHDYFLQMIGSNQNILDFGCGEGYFAREIQLHNNRITGVDALKSPKYIESFEQYISMDLDTDESILLASLENTKFDRILLFDILEHLKFGEKLLKNCKKLLTVDGLLLVSVPNVANITVRLGLFFGFFNYTERGILDKTHLRFYTKKTAKKLLEKNGYQIIKQKMTVMPLELFLGISPDNFFMKFANKLLYLITKISPGLFGYQSIFVVRSK
ncbi:bifunctional glycosyltransferase/class I SAM-dependent methyltransferase [Gammaproteobacteria bacterium]|nr:bifunctional glycosyltransferase/class I SAM-dependent methyltransferase [Gammaproteobacteria bacterium]